MRCHILKRNRRKITVGGKQYVWWYGIGAGLCTATVSPFEDKTSKVRVAFKDTTCDCGGCGFAFPLYVELEKEQERRRLKLIEPGTAALLTMYLSKRGLFKTRKEVILHGYALLADMGYHIIQIENGVDF